MTNNNILLEFDDQDTLNLGLNTKSRIKALTNLNYSKEKWRGPIMGRST